MRRSHSERTFAIRLLLLTLGAAYCAAFRWTYVSYLSVDWYYWGFANRELPWTDGCLLLLMALLPALLMPAVVNRPSHYVCWVFYLVIYVPSVLTVGFRGDTTYSWRWLDATLLLGLVMVMISGFLPAGRDKRFSLSPRSFWILFALSYGLMTLLVLRAYAGHFHFSTFADTVTQRLAARGIDDLAAGYAVPMLSNVWNPLLMAFGLFHRRRVLYLAGAAGQLFLYMTAAMKSILLLPFVLLMVYLVVQRRKRSIVPLMILSCTLMIAWATIVMSLSKAGQRSETAAQTASSLILVRTFGIPGVNTAVYADFFASHPFTYGSHVRGISLLVEYPYDTAIPYVIGEAYYGTPEVSANAHFWAQDGITGWGNAGILSVSAVMCALLWAVDWCTQHLSASFAIVFMSGFAITLTNGGLFTNLLTGGLAVALLILRVMPSAAGVARLSAAEVRARNTGTRAVRLPVYTAQGES